MTFQSLLHDFGELAEIEGIRPDADGVVKVDVDGVVVAFMEQESGRLVTWAKVGTLPHEGADHLCRRLMAESLLGLATDGAALTLDEETETVMIHRTDPLEGLDLKGFVVHLNAFLEMREKWEEIVTNDHSPISHLHSLGFMHV